MKTKTTLNCGQINELVDLTSHYGSVQDLGPTAGDLCDCHEKVGYSEVHHGGSYTVKRWDLEDCDDHTVECPECHYPVTIPVTTPEGDFDLDLCCRCYDAIFGDDRYLTEEKFAEDVAYWITKAIEGEYLNEITKGAE